MTIQTQRNGKDVLMELSNPFDYRTDIEKQIERLIAGEIDSIEINALSSGAFMNMFKLDWPEKEDIIDQACLWNGTMEYKGNTIKISGVAMWAQILLTRENEEDIYDESDAYDEDENEDEFVDEDDEE